MSEKLAIVVVHSCCRWVGGENWVFESEVALLEGRGHRVTCYTLENRGIGNMDALTLAAGAVWRRSLRREFGALFRQVRLDLVHFHNTLPSIPLAAHYAAAAQG